MGGDPGRAQGAHLWEVPPGLPKVLECSGDAARGAGMIARVWVLRPSFLPLSSFSLSLSACSRRVWKMEFSISGVPIGISGAVLRGCGCMCPCAFVEFGNGTRHPEPEGNGVLFLCGGNSV
jgi:hypothetical protein